MASISVNTSKNVTRDRHSKLMVISFRLMRQIVGVLGLSIGILLPIVSAFFSDCFHIQESISHYYYTIAGDLFVGLLCAVAFFLIMYPGEGRWEDLWTNIAGMCALAVAFFPTNYHQIEVSCTKQSFVYSELISNLHLICAGTFFLILGGVSALQVPKITAQLPANEVLKRQRFYRLCGIIMWVCIILLFPMKVSESYSNFLSAYKLVFFIEVVALVVFGLAWLMKGTEIQT